MYLCVGGYAEYIFRAAAFDLFGVQMPDGPLPFKAIRNTDFRELALEVMLLTCLAHSTIYCVEEGLSLHRAYAFQNTLSVHASLNLIGKLLGLAKYQIAFSQ